VGARACLGCHRLAEVRLARCRALALVGVEGFAECEALAALDLLASAVPVRLGDAALRGCHALAALALPVATGRGRLAAAVFGPAPTGRAPALAAITFVPPHTQLRWALAAPRADAAGRVPVGFELDQAVLTICPTLRPTAICTRGYGWGRARAQWAARRITFYIYGLMAERRCAPGGLWEAQDRASYVADSRPARGRGGGSDPARSGTGGDEVPGLHPPDA